METEAWSAILLLLILQRNWRLPKVYSVGRDNLPLALSTPVCSSLVPQKCKAMTTFHLGQFSRLCLWGTSLKDEVISPNKKQAFLQVAIKGWVPGLVLYYSSPVIQRTPMHVQESTRPTYVMSTGLRGHVELTPIP